MKPCEQIILALLALGSSTCPVEVEFSGYMQAAKISKFVLTDTEEKKTSNWLNLGQSFANCRLVAFDQKNEILTVQKGDVNVKLPLKPPHITDGQERPSLAAFRSFFSKPGTIMAKEVEDHFGPPPHYSQLLLEDEAQDVTREHSWWYYPLGPNENVGIQMDHSTVQGVYYNSPNYRPESPETEWLIRKPVKEPNRTPTPTVPSGRGTAGTRGQD